MNRSFLNLITANGKQLRIAEFGFHAELPFFDKNSIIFFNNKKAMRFDLDSGKISEEGGKCEPCGNYTSIDKAYNVRLFFESPLTEGRGYAHLILHNTASKSEVVLARFMGSEKSISPLPFSPDGKSIVFFGYPEKDDI